MTTPSELAHCSDCGEPIVWEGGLARHASTGDYWSHRGGTYHHVRLVDPQLTLFS